MVEALAAIGIVSVLAALAVPALSKIRGRAQATMTLSNIRQMGQGVMLYAASARDLPPAFAEPVWPPGPAWRFEFGESGGWWFDHSELYSLEITRLLGVTKAAFAAGHRDPPEAVMFRGQAAGLSDFSLTRALYASPRFFNWKTHQGPAQFGRQTIASVAFPADKGMLLCMQYWGESRYDGLVCCAYDRPLPVCFFDMSASEQSPLRMPSGMTNPYTRLFISPGLDPRHVPGVPVLDTLEGTQGRDRAR